MDPHPNIAVLAPLLGTWRGQGRGSYPTIGDFDYADEWVFSHTGKPFVAFVQRTRSASGQPMHTESGYLRCLDDGSVEIVAALPTGQVESGTGAPSASADGVTLATDATVTNTPSAKTVDRIVRRFTVTGDDLAIEMAMAAVGQPLTDHLFSRLGRVAGQAP